MPSWVVDGFGDYSRRLPPACSLKLVEIPLKKRHKDVARLQQAEGREMLAAIPRDTLVIALDERGESWSTRKLADNLDGWLGSGRDVALLVGGPEGLAADCLQRADRRWSLSALTLPHPLVRIVVAEQIYRAWSLLQNHPYHRE
jgi:23S rRNA (pseudouridine1915-N3)-methyltransferase